MLDARALEDLLPLVKGVGAFLLEQQHKTLEVERKADGSPQSSADREADFKITNVLKNLYPQIPIISEESAPEVPYETRKDWPQFWLVDPLDGTKEFLAGRPDFTVNIALVEDGVPVLGIIGAPAHNLLYYGLVNQGSFKVEGDGKAQRLISHAPAPGSAVSIVESRSHRSSPTEDPELARRLATYQVQDRLPIGSSLKFCYLAEGKAQLYYRQAPSMEWDLAAGDAIFRYSGHPRPRHSPLKYNKPSLRNPGFLL